jgi:hypothetical protein
MEWFPIVFYGGLALAFVSIAAAAWLMLRRHATVEAVRLAWIKCDR